MENLTIKELAAYLPYNAIIFNKDSISIGIKPIHKLHYGEGIGSFSHILSSNKYQLVLHPLSSLTKEITINGETFVPIEWLEEKYYTLDLHLQCERLTEEDGENWINQSDYMLVEQLLEWKFDIFNLIERGLAIPVSETFNPYK
jgi:hypothetical protein